MEKIIVEQNGAVATIWLNQPEKLNALSIELRDEFIPALRELGQNPEVRCIVLAGKGRAFCAGGDVKAMGNIPITEDKRRMDSLLVMIDEMAAIKKPIIAAVHGFAAGAGFSLALACDMIVAADTAKFALSFRNVGLIPDGGLLYYLPRKVGMWKAKEWIFTGKVLSMEEAREYQLVNRIVQEAELMTQVYELAEELAAGPAHAIGLAKNIINMTTDKDLRSTVEYEHFAQLLLKQTADHKEGVAAFKEKRKPEFNQ